MNCTICGKPVALMPSAAERAAKTGESDATHPRGSTAMDHARTTASDMTKVANTRLFLEQCVKDGMSVSDVVERFGLTRSAAYHAAGDLFAAQKLANREQALAGAVEAYKAGAPAFTAARAAGLHAPVLLAKLAELGILYEPRRTGPTGGPRYKTPADVMSDRHSPNYKRVRDLLLAGKTRGEAAKEVGVTRAFTSLVAIDLRAYGFSVTTVRGDGVSAAVREAAENGKYTAAEVAERTGLPKDAVYAVAGKLKRQSGITILRKPDSVNSKHKYVRDFVIANPDVGPSDVARQLGVPYRVAAIARLRVRKSLGIASVPKLRRSPAPATVAVMEHVLRNQHERPEATAAALGVSIRKVRSIRQKLHKKGSLAEKLTARVTQANTRSLMSYMRANPTQKPRDVAAANGVSARRVCYVRHKMRKEQPGSLPAVRRSKQNRGNRL